MLFFLDHNVDAAVGKVLRRGGHRCHTAWQLGVDDAEDDLLSVLAHDRGAVLVTHDVEFSQRRMAHTFGRHLWLHCQDTDAVKVLEHHLEEVVTALGAQATIVVAVSTDRIRVYPPDWR